MDDPKPAPTPHPLRYADPSATTAAAERMAFAGRVTAALLWSAGACVATLIAAIAVMHAGVSSGAVMFTLVALACGAMAWDGWADTVAPVARRPRQ